MKPITFSFLLIALMSTPSLGQTYRHQQIFAAADSAIRISIEPSLIKHVFCDSAISYAYETGAKKTKWSILKKREKTKGGFLLARVHYTFVYPEQLIATGFISSDLSVELRYNLSVRNRLDLDFIPDYVKAARPCDFIKMQQAIDIATREKIKPGIDPIFAQLGYSHDMKLYVWMVKSILTRRPGSTGEPRGQIDVVNVNALTQEVLNHDTHEYGAFPVKVRK